MPSTVFALNIHAGYRCRHSGACCSADWDVPVELPIYRSLAGALEQGRLATVPEAQALVPFILEPDLPAEAAAIIERTGAGHCVFFDRGSHLCVVHRDLGEPALPLTCRHFPRVALRDPRGTFITLSHYCPTAAALLFEVDEPVRIVTAPAAFPPGDYDGFAVTDDDLPPLLQPRMLMDHDGYAAWEAHMVQRCASPDASPESAVATLMRDAQIVRAWRPGGVTLSDAVAALPAAMVPAAVPADLHDSLQRHREVITAVPEDLKPTAAEDGLDAAYAARVRPVWPDYRAVLARYLGAKAFASWTAYQGQGIATIVRGLDAALALVRVDSARRCRDEGCTLDAALLLESVRAADFTLNHLAVGEDLAAAWATAEI